MPSSCVCRLRRAGDLDQKGGFRAGTGVRIGGVIWRAPTTRQKTNESIYAVGAVFFSFMDSSFGVHGKYAHDRPPTNRPLLRLLLRSPRQHVETARPRQGPSPYVFTPAPRVCIALAGWPAPPRGLVHVLRAAPCGQPRPGEVIPAVGAVRSMPTTHHRIIPTFNSGRQAGLPPPASVSPHSATTRRAGGALHIEVFNNLGSGTTPY